jgi:hypothetical protein
MIPQILMLLLLAFSAGISVTNAGKPNTGTHKVLPDIVGLLLLLGLMAWGGFFDCFLR